MTTGPGPGGPSAPGPPGPVDAFAAHLAADPSRGAIFVDFDGSLAPIVPRPEDARPLPGAVDALARLAAAGAQVAVISGRPVAFLEPWFPAAIRLAGLYGLERRVDGGREEHPDLVRWRPAVAAAAARARRDLPAEVLVEDKGGSLTLHFRGAPQLAERVAAWARGEVAGDAPDETPSEATGEAGSSAGEAVSGAGDESAGEAVGGRLEVRPAKMSVELHPPVRVDKGRVVREWAQGAALVLFAGDDAGDLPAFGAVAELGRLGRTTLGVAVVGPDAPPAVPAAADLTVPGPEGLAELLAELADAVS